jgi:hypothetical protein
MWFRRKEHAESRPHHPSLVLDLAVAHPPALPGARAAAALAPLDRASLSPLEPGQRLPATLASTRGDMERKRWVHEPSRSLAECRAQGSADLLDHPGRLGEARRDREPVHREGDHGAWLVTGRSRRTHLEGPAPSRCRICTLKSQVLKYPHCSHFPAVSAYFTLVSIGSPSGVAAAVCVDSVIGRSPSLLIN